MNIFKKIFLIQVIIFHNVQSARPRSGNITSTIKPLEVGQRQGVTAQQIKAQQSVLTARQVQQNQNQTQTAFASKKNQSFTATSGGSRLVGSHSYIPPTRGGTVVKVLPEAPVSKASNQGAVKPEMSFVKKAAPKEKPPIAPKPIKKEIVVENKKPSKPQGPVLEVKKVTYVAPRPIVETVSQPQVGASAGRLAEVSSLGGATIANGNRAVSVSGSTQVKITDSQVGVKSSIQESNPTQRIFEAVSPSASVATVRKDSNKVRTKGVTTKYTENGIPSGPSKSPEITLSKDLPVKDKEQSEASNHLQAAVSSKDQPIATVGGPVVKDVVSTFEKKSSGVSQVVYGSSHLPGNKKPSTLSKAEDAQVLSATQVVANTRRNTATLNTKISRFIGSAKIRVINPLDRGHLPIDATATSALKSEKFVGIQ